MKEIFSPRKANFLENLSTKFAKQREFFSMSSSYRLKIGEKCGKILAPSAPIQPRQGPLKTKITKFSLRKKQRENDKSLTRNFSNQKSSPFTQKI
jgi:hypothetical protein